MFTVCSAATQTHRHMLVGMRLPSTLVVQMQGESIFTPLCSNKLEEICDVTSRHQGQGFPK